MTYKAQPYNIQHTVSPNSLVGLWRKMTGYRLPYFGAVISLAIAAVACTDTFLLLRYLIDEVLGEETNLDRIWLIAAGLVFLAAIEGTGSFLRGKLSSRTAESITKRLRDYLFDHLQRLPFTYHDRTRTGEMIERVTSDVEAMRRFYSKQAVEIGRILALFVFNLIALLSLNQRLGLCSVALMPLILDDSTSSVDAETEEVIQNALEGLMKEGGNCRTYR